MKVKAAVPHRQLLHTHKQKKETLNSPGLVHSNPLSSSIHLLCSSVRNSRLVRCAGGAHHQSHHRPHPILTALCLILLAIIIL